MSQIIQESQHTLRDCMQNPQCADGNSLILYVLADLDRLAGVLRAPKAAMLTGTRWGSQDVQGSEPLQDTVLVSQHY